MRVLSARCWVLGALLAAIPMGLYAQVPVPTDSTKPVVDSTQHPAPLPRPP
jgi:hypothetical protein